jgi:Mn-dependent DtxR family transcriptional regulator
MTETDYRILSGLDDAEELPVQSPAVLAKNIGKSRPYVSTRLSRLVDRGLVEKVEDGYYRITPRGRQKLTEP